MHKEQPSKAELKTKNTPASGQIAKKPKETYKIEALLKAYVAYQDRIDLAEERLAFLEYKQGSPSSPNLSGMSGTISRRKSSKLQSLAKIYNSKRGAANG